MQVFRLLVVNVQVINIVDSMAILNMVNAIVILDTTGSMVRVELVGPTKDSMVFHVSAILAS
jgi:hypothetical protein